MAAPFSYPFPTTLNVANFITIKLKQNNYLLWETHIISLIESQGLLRFINGDSPSPAQEIDQKGIQIINPDYTSWVKTDKLIKAWITGTLSEEVLGHAVRTKSSKELWTMLSDPFSQASEAREFEIQSMMQYHKKMESMTLTQYVSGLKTIFDQLNAIGKLVPDKTKVFLLITNLGPTYEAFSTTMLKPPVPTYSEIIPLLHSHELRNKHHKPAEVNQSMAFYSNTNNKGKDRSGNNNSFSS
ncbi:UBN2_3 domain-containing protein [Cephalotus follicularis]|uniref:UBN2_3 domain-containing protein n=1 Tax=Cephalotus follicularis TaxID=3775 RepID=A0A1Q3BM16_CEPFO|nr:UBN2_3 domain-containing protein [Cephalotus follicularis]